MTDRDKAIEVVAEAIWQAQSIRATDKPRREDWAVQSEKTKDEWRFLAHASLTAYESHLRAKGLAVVPVGTVDTLDDHIVALLRILEDAPYSGKADAL